jgi:bifunctional oligoribonuclease and PAP phosphatase NrnA
MKYTSRIIGRVLEGIRQSETIGVVGHIRPDGDCIGSQLALSLALKNEGKKVTCWNDDDVPGKLAFLDRDQLIKKPRNGQHFDCVIALDSASLERLGNAQECIQDRNLLINIDHHESNTRFADLNWVSAKQPSTGELIFRLMRAAKWPITPHIADCLFTAISTDTGSFQYPSTRPGTFYIAGNLVERGVDLAKVCNEVYQSYPLSRVRLLQRVLNKLRLTQENQIAYFWLKKADFARTGAGQDDAEGLIDHIRAIEPVIVACVFEELEPELTRVSLRSKSEKVSVNAIAQRFGGGGHPAAAGARIPGSPLSAQRRVIGEVKRVLARAH